MIKDFMKDTTTEFIKMDRYDNNTIAVGVGNIEEERVFNMIYSYDATQKTRRYNANLSAKAPRPEYYLKKYQKSILQLAEKMYALKELNASALNSR